MPALLSAALGAWWTRSTSRLAIRMLRRFHLSDPDSVARVHRMTLDQADPYSRRPIFHDIHPPGRSFWEGPA